jgi:hypothetical protein
MKDPLFIADAEKLRLPVMPRSGEEALKVVETIYATKPDVIEAARKLAGD